MKSVNIMLYRKIGNYIEDHFKTDTDKILIVEGARQIGKSYIIREVGKRLFKNFVEINFVKDDEGEQTFKNIKTTEEFYLNLSMLAGKRLDKYQNTLIFLDEIQQYPQYLLFRRYLLVGGMPDAVNTYLATHNIVKVREIQESIRSMYGEDATGTDNEDIYF